MWSPRSLGGAPPTDLGYDYDKIKNNEVQGHLFFTTNVTLGGHFFALAHMANSDLFYYKSLT